MSTADPTAPKAPAEATLARHREALGTLPPDDGQDLEDAQRGFIASLPEVEIRKPDGGLVWSLSEYAFLAQEEAPPSVHPSLWRQARLNLHHGLFQVTDRIYQVRGFDISNMTIIEGDRGVIVIDPLISTETARAAMDLYASHRGQRPVTAVIYTHSHVDHYGGVKGIVSEADVRAGKVPVIAPARFMDEITQETVLVGGPMARRAMFQFGPTLARGPRGQVDAGLGKTLSRGTITLIAPTVTIDAPEEVHTLDGVEIRFQLTPDTEAKAEMHMFYPGLRALNLAENATHNLHNIYPIRGAQVRDANQWAKYLNEALHRYAGGSDVVFAQHHWPVWGAERVREFLARQRDGYKYLHDQTVRLMNHGRSAADIAEALRFPASLERQWHLRGYYGTLSHNAKSVYQRYLGWYDANPAHLNPLPTTRRAAKMVEYMGGAEAALERARRDYEQGEFRWVAEVAGAVVFAEPGHRQARELAADALEQLGYQTESATWRNAYLLGAHELRHGLPGSNVRAPVRADVIASLPVPLFFDYLGVRLNGPRAEGVHLVVNWHFTDLDERYVLNLENCALTYRADHSAADAHATVTLARPALNRIILGEATLEAALADGSIRVDGDASALPRLFGLLDSFAFLFPILEPPTEDIG